MPITELNRLKRDCLNCKRCNLHETRTKVVFGEGSWSSKIMLVGEAPGKEEDRTGIPFVGKAGKMLDSILKSAGFEREKLYTSSILKCRPPRNRKPLDHEIKACCFFIDNQIRILQPRVVVLMGNVAVNSLTGLEGIRKLHGRMVNDGTRGYFLTYHPAAAIYKRELKMEIINDFISLLQYLNSHYRD